MSYSSFKNEQKLIIKEKKIKHSDILPHICQTGKIKLSDKQALARVWRKDNSFTAGGRVSWYRHFRKTVSSVVDWKKCPSKDVHGLIPGICECYHMWPKKKKNFANFIQVNILRWDYRALFGRVLNAVTCILIRGRKREISHGGKRRKCDHRNTETEIGVMWPQT